MAKLTTIACLLFVVALLVADKHQHATGKAVAKLSASLAFIATSVLNGALDWGDHAKLILVGLVLGAVGDAALLSNDKRPFLLGIAAFLLSHLAYIAAFVVLGLSWRGGAASLLLLIPVGIAVRRWVGDKAGSLGPAVTAYVVVITAMVACSIGALVATVNPHRIVLLTAAVLFFVSDICVARERFVTPGFVNRLVGLPLYYVAQLLFAWSVTVVGLARG